MAQKIEEKKETQYENSILKLVLQMNMSKFRIIANKSEIDRRQYKFMLKTLLVYCYHV